MPRIPQISFASAPPASASGVGVSPGALAQEVGEKGEAWQGFGDLAEVFGTLALDIQKRAVETQIMRIERDYGDMVNAYNNERLTDPDPGNWVRGFEERESHFRDQLDSGDLPPEAQARLRDRLADFGYRAKTRIVRDAAVAQAEIGTQELLNRETAYTAEGDFEGAIQSWQENGPAMGYHPTEIEAKVQRLTEQGKRYQAKQEADDLRAAREADFNAAASMLSVDPFGVPEAIDAGAFPSLDDVDNLRLKSQARTAQDRFQGEATEEIINSIIDGSATEGDLIRISEDARLKPAQIEEILGYRSKRARLEAEQAPIDYAAIGLGRAAIKNYDRKQDPTGETYNRIKSSLDLAVIGGGDQGQELVKPLFDALEDKHPYTSPTDQGKMRSEITREFSKVFETYRANGAFGGRTPDEENLFWFDKKGELLEEGDEGWAEAEREWAAWYGDLSMKLREESERDPDRFRERGSVGDWVADQVKGRAFGETLKGDSTPTDPIDDFDDFDGALKILGF